jgi:hypothetical protein
VTAKASFQLVKLGCSGETTQTMIEGEAAGQELALQSASLLGQFNAVLRAIYGLFSVPAGDVAAAFDSADFTTIVDAPGLGPVPQNVALVCAWTWMCVFLPQGPNIHPNADGYGVISEVIPGVRSELRR